MNLDDVDMFFHDYYQELSDRFQDRGASEILQMMSAKYILDNKLRASYLETIKSSEIWSLYIKMIEERREMQRIGPLEYRGLI